MLKLTLMENWLSENLQWLFDGVLAGAAAPPLSYSGYFIHRFSNHRPQMENAALNAQEQRLRTARLRAAPTITQTVIPEPQLNLAFGRTKPSISRVILALRSIPRRCTSRYENPRTALNPHLM